MAIFVSFLADAGSCRQLFGYGTSDQSSKLADREPKRLRASGRDWGLSHDNAIPVSSHNAPFPSSSASTQGASASLVSLSRMLG